MFQTERSCYSKITESASNEYDHIFKSKLGIPKSILYNATLFYFPRWHVPLDSGLKITMNINNLQT